MSRKLVAAQALERLEQLRDNLREVLEKPDEVPLNAELASQFVQAVDAYTLKTPTKRKKRARSMDVALGLKRPPGRAKGTNRGGLPTAIHAHYLRAWGYSWIKTADFLGKDVRSLQRIYLAHETGIREHLLGLCGDLFVPLGYDVKDGKLIVNECEAATVRMIFERYAREGSATALVRSLEAEGITGRRGKPIVKSYLFRLLNDRIYFGETASKGIWFPYPGKPEAIVDRVLWERVHPEHSKVAFDLRVAPNGC